MKSRITKLYVGAILALTSAGAHAVEICTWEHPDAAKEADWQENHINDLNRKKADIKARVLPPAQNSANQASTDVDAKTKIFNSNQLYHSQLAMISGGMDLVEQNLATDTEGRQTLSQLNSSSLPEFKEGLQELSRSPGVDAVASVLNAFESIDRARAALTSEAKIAFIQAVTGSEMPAIRMGLAIARRSLAAQTQIAVKQEEDAGRDLTSAQGVLSQATQALQNVNGQISDIDAEVKTRTALENKAISERGRQNCDDSPLLPRPT